VELLRFFEAHPGVDVSLYQARKRQMGYEHSISLDLEATLQALAH
jgi:hypothetical protein